MNRDFLISLLLEIKNGKREYRDTCAQKIIKQPDLFVLLLEETFYVDNKLSIKSTWVLEWICTHYGINLLLPHLELFIDKLNTVYLDGSKRCLAKICEQLGEIYSTEPHHEIRRKLSTQQIEQIVEINFDWLISPQKIAVKAYAMTTLYHFGFYVNWVHEAIENTIANDVMHTSKACEARGKKILTLLKKK